VAFHRANTNIFGNFYFGNGVQNTDLVFMIWSSLVFLNSNQFTKF
jgi:hypothetical protein